jgi:hypothetical protein
MELGPIHQPNAIDVALHQIRQAVWEARGERPGGQTAYPEHGPLLPVDGFGSRADEVDRIGAELARAIEDADELELRESRIRSGGALNVVLSVAHRLAYAAWMRSDGEQLSDGLFLRAFADGGSDYRDTMLGLAPFHRQAAAMGLDVPAVFDRVADACPLPEVGRTLRVFGRRTDVEDGGGWHTFDWMRPREVDD